MTLLDMTQYCRQYYNDENGMYRQTSNMNRTKSQNSNFSRLTLSIVFAQSIAARCYVETKDVVGTAPTGGVVHCTQVSSVTLLIRASLYPSLEMHYCGTS